MTAEKMNHEELVAALDKARFARAMLQQIKWTMAVTMEAVEQLPPSPQQRHIRKQLGHILWMIGPPLEGANED